MTKPTILMLGAYSAPDMAALESLYDVHRLWEQPDAAHYLQQHGERFRALATRGDLGASRELMEKLPKLEIIVCFGVGTDAIDLAAARERGIAVTNTPDVLTDDVADLALALMLAVARKIPQGDALTRRGTWPQQGLPLTTRMTGKRLGIVGMGRIGAAVAKRAAAFDMAISYFGRSKRDALDYQYTDNLVALAQRSDFLMATVAGGKDTAGMISAEVLKALGPEGFFINVARGSVVDEPALLTALETKAIKGAALDVFYNEPHVDPRFFALDNVVLCPHHGSGTAETRAAMGQLVRDNLAAHFAGQSLLTPV